MKTESISKSFANIISMIFALSFIIVTSVFSQLNVWITDIPSYKFPKVEAHVHVGCVSKRWDLQKSNFSIKENGVVIPDFTFINGAPSFALVFDRSTSMAGQKLTQMKNAAKALIDMLDTNIGQAAVISFSDTAVVNVPLTTDKTLLKNAIDGLTASGNKAVWDGTAKGIEEMQKISPYSGHVRMVFLFSDGFDNASTQNSSSSCITLARGYSYHYVAINPVAIGSPYNQIDFKSLADSTVGHIHVSPQSCADYVNMYNTLPIFGEAEYTLIYNSTMCTETRDRIVEVTVGNSIYCCTGTATARWTMTPSYRSEEIHIALDTVTVVAKNRTDVRLVLADSMYGLFRRATFKVQFDTAMNRFIGISTSGYLLNGVPASFQRVQDGVIISLNDSICVHGTGPLASLTFEVSNPHSDTECILYLQDWHFDMGRFTAKTHDGLIRIFSHWLNLSSPLDGESYCVGDNVNVEWTQSRVDTVNIDLSRDGGKYYSPLAANVLSSPFVWTIPTDQTPGTNYRIRVREKDGELIDTSKNNFTINIPPRITIQPQNKTVCEGQNVIFYSFAVSYPLPAVQWQRSSDEGTSWDDLIGENNDTLRLINVQRSSQHESKYRGFFTNACGNSTSDEAVLNVNSFPLVATHPHDTIICEGATLYLASYASGFPAPKSQWQTAPENGTTWTDIADETTDTLKLVNIKRGAFNYQYRNVFTNDCGVATSNPAIVRVGDPLSITSQPLPKSQTVCTGRKITFSVQAIGSNVKYQWLHNGNILSGKNTSTLTIDSSAINDDGYYIASITGDCSNGIASDSVFVNVNHPAIVTSQPKNQTLCQGKDAIFRTANISKPQASIQWQVSNDNGKTFSDLVGVKNDSLKIINIQLIGNGNQYRAVLNNSCGSVTTQPAILLVNSKSPTITSQPQDQNVCEGSMATFNVTSFDAASYQWRKNGMNISGETASILIINNVKSSDTGLYDAIVLNTCGQTISSSAKLSEKIPIQIITDPISQTVKENSSVAFQSSVVGTNPTFQWLKNGNPISNATDSILAIAAVKKSDEGDYTVRVNGACGNHVTSNIAKLLVTVVSVIDHGIIPTETKLFQNYPNPFRTFTTISFSLSQTDYVSIKVYDIFGKEILTLIDQQLHAGIHSVKLDAVTIVHGIYYYTLRTRSSKETKRFLLLK